MSVLKRKLVTIGMAIAMLGTVGITAAAQDYSANPQTYTTSITGQYSKMSLNVNTTELTTTTAGKAAGYDVSWKKVKYHQWTYSNGSFVLLLSRENAGDTTTVSTASVSVSNYVAKRSHVAFLYYTASPSSGQIDYLYGNVIKPGTPT